MVKLETVTILLATSLSFPDSLEYPLKTPQRERVNFVTPNNHEHLQPLDPENDPLISQAPEETSSEDDLDESDTFEIIEPTVSPQQNRQSEFADPLIPEPVSDEASQPEQELEPLPDLVPASRQPRKPANAPPNIKIKQKQRQTRFEESGSSDATQEEEKSPTESPPKGLKELCQLTCKNGEQVACKMRSLFRLPEPKPTSSTWQGKIMGMIRPVIHCLFGLLYWIYSYLQNVFKYYFDHRKGIWFYLLDLLKHVPPTEVYQREIRLREKDAEELKMLKNDVWNISLPHRCIQCGQTNNCNRQQVSQHVENYRTVLMGFLAGLLTSLFFSIMTWSLLLFLSSPIIGLLCGYLLRKPIRVKVEYSTSKEHQNQTEFPQIRFYGEEIFLLVGDRNVRQDFIQELEEAGISRKR